MIQQSKGKIFLADEREINQTESARSFNTFNSGRYFNPHKQAFGNMYVLNDDTLVGGASVKMPVEESSHIILLPVAGAINYKDSFVNDALIVAGQAQLLSAGKESAMEISNPFKEEFVNFLQIHIKADNTPWQSALYLSTYDDVNKNRNSLVELFPGISETSSLPFAVSIGKFYGRGETTYHLKKKDAGLFLFVLEGAFEAEGRLLHARDGLALWGIDEVELEALSNDAIILLIEQELTI